MHDFNHILKVLASSIEETLWPTRCIGCDAPGTLLCPECRSKLPYIDARSACPECAAPYGMTDCTECQHSTRRSNHPETGTGDCHELSPRFPFAAARAAVSYEGIAKRLISAYKDHDELRLDSAIATLVCQAMRGELRLRTELPAEQRGARVADWTIWADVIVPIPASAEALCRRGFDHMGRVARLCGEYTGLPVLDALVQTRRAVDQRSLDPGARALNRRGSFAVAPDVQQPLPRRIVLVDDVLTTGATASAATEALLAGGAGAVALAVCARVW